MKKIILLIFVLIELAYGQDALKVYSYGNWISCETDSVYLINADTDTVFFSFRTVSRANSVAPDTNSTTYNPPDAVWWGKSATIEIIPTYVTSDSETDSLKVWIKALDLRGNIMNSQVANCDFTGGDWETSAQIFNWANNTAYNASISTAFSPCFGFAVFVQQYAVSQSSKVIVRLIRD